MPYKEICHTLFGRSDAWDRLKEQGHARFISTTAIRGISIDDAIIIVDENQNLNWSEVNTIITRVGHRSKIIFSGDFKQTDLIKNNRDQSAFHNFLEVARKMPSFQEVYFTPDDIVRIAVGQNGGNGGPNLWDFNANGTTVFPGGLIGSGASPAPYISGFDSISSISVSASGNISANNFTGNGGGLSNVATKTTGSWTLAAGTNTVNISVPLNGTYSIWVNGNIPNGIITYTATAVVTNTNVPVLGEQYGWFYEAGNALVLTSIPNQFVGTVSVFGATLFISINLSASVDAKV